MTEFVEVVTATGSEEEARRIATSVVEARLAACAQVAGPVSSTHWWKGEVEQAEEWLCICKSSRALYAQLEKAIREAHSYEVPQIVALPVSAGSSDYVSWLRAELAGAG
jgi:periplasmic divalent cation tolerance protein